MYEGLNCIACRRYLEEAANIHDDQKLSWQATGIKGPRMATLCGDGKMMVEVC